MKRSVISSLPLAVLLAWPLFSQPQAASTPLPVGSFAWHDLVTDDAAAARAFYGALFGWTFTSGDGVDPGYTIIKEGTRPIGGIVVRPRQADADAQWLSYVVVADVDKAAAAFANGGGRIFRGPLDARPDLRVAVVSDPQGAALGLANRGPAVAGEDDLPGLNRWLWMDYVASDPDRALEFYATALGYRHEVGAVRNTFTYHLLTADRPRAGLFLNAWAPDRSTWLPYIRVADPAALAARVTGLGGRVVLAPAPGIRNGSLAIVLDPAGAPIALQKFPFEPAVVP